MSFFKKSQQELDAEFLKAVSKHKFKRAHKWLKKGASVFATDQDGNNAFHVLMKASPWQGDTCHSSSDDDYYLRYDEAESFIRYLQAQKLDINARNKDGKIPLHLIAANKRDDKGYLSGHSECGLIEIALDAGGDPHAKDRYACQPLHFVSKLHAAESLKKFGADLMAQTDAGDFPATFAVRNGNEELTEFYLKHKLCLADSADGKDCRLYEVAEASNHYRLAQIIKARRVAYLAAQDPPAHTTEDSSEDSGWEILGKERISYISEDAGYKITYIFNFNAEHLTCVTHSFNLATKTDAPAETKDFKNFPARTLLQKAQSLLTEAGNDVAPLEFSHAEKVLKAKNNASL